MVRTAVAVLLAVAASLGAGAPATAAAAEIELPGVPVENPSTDPGAPTPLEAGTWADTLVGPGGSADATHQFVYQRTMRASTVYVGVTGANSEEGDALQLVAKLPDGEECGDDSSDSGFENTFGTFGAAVVVGPDEPNDGDSACLVADELLLSVGRGDSSVAAPLDLSLRIVEEAPTVSDVAELPTPAETPRVAPPDVPDAEPTGGAVTFDNAPYLTDGSYAETVAEGAERFWRVRLTWGQQLSVRLRLPRADEATVERLGGFGPSVQLVLVDPLLNSIPDAVEGAETSGDYDVEAVSLRDGTPPVAYNNRYATGDAVLPGDYWVTVSVAEPDEGRAPIEVPMQLDVQVSGEDGAGAPAFPATVQGPGGETGPDGYAAETPYLVGAGTFAADVSGSPEPPPTEGPDDGSSGEDDTAASATDGDDTTRRLAGLGAGVAGLLCCAAGLLLLRRRSRWGRD